MQTLFLFYPYIQGLTYSSGLVSRWYLGQHLLYQLFAPPTNIFAHLHISICGWQYQWMAQEPHDWQVCLPLCESELCPIPNFKSKHLLVHQKEILQMMMKPLSALSMWISIIWHICLQSRKVCILENIILILKAHIIKWKELHIWERVKK